MDEKEDLIEEEEIDNKIHFPKSGLFIIGGIIFLMIACIVVIVILGNR